MDLIAVDSDLKERFVLQNYNSDFALGDENSFSISIHINEYERFRNIKYFSVDHTEFGGTIDNINVDTEGKTITYTGRCWRGMLEDKIIIPPSGSDYYIQSGTACEIMQQVLILTGLNPLFVVKEFDSPSISSYRFNRYCSVLEGFISLLNSIDYVIVLEYENGHVSISAEQLKTVQAVDNYDCELSVSKNLSQYNHLICLGKGELKDRQVLHLYLDKNGSIGKSQYYTGIDERVSVYDYPNVDDLAALEEYGIKRFEELLESENAEISLSNAEFNIGHYLQAYEHITGTAVKKKISKKILTLVNGRGVVNYEVNG